MPLSKLEPYFHMLYRKLLWPIAAISLLLPTYPILAEKKTPNNLQPLPDAPPPSDLIGDDQTEPEVTIRYNQGEKIEEIRINGQLAFIKVTPTHGLPYYLVPTKQEGSLMRQDQLDSGLAVPKWILKRF